nr:hypothetical protein [Pseudolysinimonas kribbensis]
MRSVIAASSSHSKVWMTLPICRTRMPASASVVSYGIRCAACITTS